jgi:hypothetical protein
MIPRYMLQGFGNGQLGFGDAELYEKSYLKIFKESDGA